MARSVPRSVHRASSSAPLALVAMLGTMSTACSKIPPGRSAVDEVTVKGVSSIDPSDVTDHLATAASEKFFGMFRGLVYDYEIYDPTVLQRDLARVERYMRGRGFFEAHARAARVEQISANHVRVEIVVEEGPPAKNRYVALSGLESLPPDLAGEIYDAARGPLPQGRRFDEEDFKRSKSVVQRALTDRGYAWAKVDADAAVDVGAHAVDYSFTVTPGPAATFGAVTFVGLDPDGGGPKPQEIEEKPLRRAVAIKPGDRYSTKALDDATQALLDLEVFSAVDFDQALPDPPPADAVVPITFRLEPQKLRELHAGFGAEFDFLKTDLHLLGGWEDHNFLGGLRDFTVDFQPGVVLYPTRADNFVVPERLLPQEKLKFSLSQPSFLEQRTRGFIKPELNVTALIVATSPKQQTTTDPNALPNVGYIEGKTTIGADRPFGKAYVSLEYTAQVESPFTYHGDLDPVLKTLTLSFPELVTKLDLRDDPNEPHAGAILMNTFQIAGGPFGGTATDISVQPEIDGFVPLSKRVTLALHSYVGLMFPQNYGDVIEHHLDDDPTDANAVRDIQITYFRGFYSGGPSSNRGYPLRGIAPHGYVPFLNPRTANQQAALGCDPTKFPSGKLPADQQAACSLPIGGFSAWEASVEVRWDVAGPFWLASFCDASDVSQNVLDIRLDRPHLSCGGGLRYDTPVGPIRLDIGYRVQPLQIIGFKNETAAAIADPINGAPQRLFGTTDPTTGLPTGGIPIAVAFGIGEAF